MQIKFVRFISILMLMFVTNVSSAAVTDWFAENCKRIENSDGLAFRKKDLKKNAAFKDAVFYKGLCSGKKAPTGTSKCIKLTDVQLQSMAQAIQVAKDYVKERYNREVTCLPAYFGCKDNDDHILCSTANNSDHYEFIFDDITEKKDEKYKKGIGTAYCRTFFGDEAELFERTEHNYNRTWKFDSNNVTRSFNEYAGCSGPNIYEEIPCQKMSDSLEASFGYFAQYYESSCTINFIGKNDCSSISANTEFKNMQTNLDQSLVAWLGAHVQKQLGNKKDMQFRCNLAPSTCNNSGNLFNKRDDVLTCYADDQAMYFIFDDLSESKKYKRKSMEDAKKCLDADGVYDGRRCQGLDETACTALRTQSAKNPNPIPTKWKNGMCTMSNSNFDANVTRLQEVAGAVGITVALAGLTIASAGADAPVVIVALGSVAAAYGVEFTKEAQRKIIADFTRDLMACGSLDCVNDKLVYFEQHGSNYLDNLEHGQVDAIDSAFANRIKNIDFSDAERKRLLARLDKAEDKTTWEKCKGDALQGANCAFVAMTIVLDVIQVPKAATKLFTSKLTKLPKLTRALQEVEAVFVQAQIKELKGVSTAANTISKTQKAAEVSGLM